MPTQWEPSITVRAVQPLVDALDVLNQDTDDILSLCAISRNILNDADGRVPHSAMMQFWEEAVASTGDEHLGIHLAEVAPLESFGVHTYALLSSPTLRSAYRRAARYQRLIHEATDLKFDEQDHEGILHHALPGGRPVPRQPAEFLATLWVRFGRLITNSEWAPRLVRFSHSAPPNTSEHERVFVAPLHFAAGRTAMHIPNDLLDLGNVQEDAGLVAVLDDYAERLLAQMPSATTLSECVRTQLIQKMQDELPRAEDVAQSLNMSTRTLHRNLRQEGVTYRELLTQLRKELAATHLANPQLNISEVAFLLGFSELSSFYRAFRRWTGTTPAEYRANILDSTSPSLPLE